MGVLRRNTHVFKPTVAGHLPHHELEFIVFIYSGRDHAVVPAPLLGGNLAVGYTKIHQ